MTARPTGNDTVDGKWVNAVPGERDGSVIDAAFLNAINEGLCRLIEAGNQTLGTSNYNSIKNAVSQIAQNIATTTVNNSGGGGGGGSTPTGAGELVARQTAKSSNNANTTSTNDTAISQLKLSYTPQDKANLRIAQFFVDFEITNNSASAAAGEITLQKSLNNSNWTDIKRFSKKLEGAAGGSGLVKSSKSSLSSDSSTKSTAFTDSGLSINYTSASGANKRNVKVFINSELKDNKGSIVNGEFALQYNAGGSWQDLQFFSNKQKGGFQNSSLQEIPIYFEYSHTANDSTPQYRVVHKTGDNDDQSTIRGGSFIEVEEYGASASKAVLADCFSWSEEDDQDVPGSESQAHYRIMYKASSGSNIQIKAGSKITVHEYN
jgi:hypothetical protein